MSTLMVRQDAWDALSPGQRFALLHTNIEGRDAQLGDPAPMLDETNAEWLVWDGAVAETTIALFAALVANPDLIPEPEADDAG